ncbi:MAG: hypothetical protein ACE5FK_04945 [Candidatus Methylomirabilia bacterium]
MRAFTLIVALVALVAAFIALARTGGIDELRQQVKSLSSQTEMAREKAADALDRLERLIRDRESSS